MDALSLDEHDDYDEEADEAEASYLYDYDVQLKDLGICSSIVPAAYNTEEDLARIRSKYKGFQYDFNAKVALIAEVSNVERL